MCSPAFALSFLLATSALAQSPVVGIWNFDETAGLTTADIGPNANTGTLVNFTNDPAQWVAGQHGNALQFDGVDDYVDIAFNGGLPFFDNTGQAFSIAFWVNGQPTADDRVLSLSSVVNNTPLFTLGTGGTGAFDKLRVYVRSDVNRAIASLSDAVVFDGTWHHVAYIEHAGEGRVYIDGVLDTGSYQFDFRLEPFTFDKLTLGSVVRSSACCFGNFAIDDLQVYGFPLSAADVATTMNGVPVATCRASYAEWGTGCGGGPHRLGVIGSPVLGGPGLGFTMRGGVPNGASILAFGLGAPAPFDLSGFGLVGCYLYPQSATIVPGPALGPFGSTAAAIPFPVPNVPSLACQTVTFQGASTNGVTTGTSNAVLVLLGN